VPRLFAEGIADDVAALDMSGHGRSAHRGNAYHAVDFASEVLFTASQLYGADASFSLLGHSLGAGVALIAAGGAPERVSRLVMLEGFGLHHKGSLTAAEQFAHANNKLPSGRLTTFASVEDACQRRAERNVVPDPYFTVDSARDLAKRGVREAPGGGYSWSTDPWLLLPTPLYMHKECQLSFAQHVAAPTLVLLTRDGVAKSILNAGPISRLGLTNSLVIMGTTVVHTAAALGLRLAPPLLAYLGLMGPAARLTSVLRRATFRLDVVSTACQRLSAIRNRTIITLDSGGHHPHIANPAKIADVVARWVGRSNGGGTRTS